MMQTLKIRIPPANTERRANGAIQRTRPARFVREAATRPMERKVLGGLIIRLPGSKPRSRPCGVFAFSWRHSVADREAGNHSHKKIATA